ncbi:ELO family [Aspergillus minisclerotigenes]|uniref:Elongation of fatty acids protein n=1 Tax=Aspergillus minisclerotigenes TaxID=656917 RepID=A0A5N6J8I4_9EURO|nr:ELO family [Aspergillus minisclerotigenes]
MSSAPSVYFGFPEARILRFPPGPHPPLITPTSQVGFSWNHPFDIPSTVYSFSLDARVPLFTACFYIVFVCVLNYLNRRRHYRPWPITRTASFTYIALAHNVFLSLFSAWAFLGVCRTVISSLPPWSSAPYHIAEVFCRFDRGQGRLLSDYSPASNTSVPLATLDNGFSGTYQDESLWERGMNYYTWMFYMSKYYEIMDTILLLVKGKKVSFLQIYHHAGVIICTWVGAIYRTPQAVVGVSFNTGIHTLMYLYYSLTTLRIKVPVFMKRTLTRLQISQFVLGGLASWLYVFISYDNPINVPLVATEDKSNIQTSVGLEVGSNVVPCMNNSGQVFALVLGTLYLVPLTQLFLKFFGRTYKLEAKQKAL